MHIHFDNGTTRQKQWFHEAVDQSKYDFTQLDAVVSVEFVPNPGPPDPNEFAYTTGVYGGPHSNMQIKDDLDDPSRPGDEGGAVPGTYAGEAFFKETVLHELGHVIINTLWQAGWQDNICDLFGQPHSAWNSGDWSDRVWEATTETFKDIFSTSENRKFLNRTNLYLPKDKLFEWLHYYTVQVPPTPTDLGGFPSVNGFLPLMEDPKLNLLAWQVDPVTRTVGPAAFRGLPGISTVFDDRQAMVEPHALLVEVYKGHNGTAVAVLKHTALEILDPGTHEIWENYPEYTAWSEAQVDFDPTDDIRYVIEPGDEVSRGQLWGPPGLGRPEWDDFRLGHDDWTLRGPVILERFVGFKLRLTLPLPAHQGQRIYPYDGDIGGLPFTPPSSLAPPYDPPDPSLSSDPAHDDPMPRGSYTGQWHGGALQPRDEEPPDNGMSAFFTNPGMPGDPTGSPAGFVTRVRHPLGFTQYPSINQYDYEYTFGWPSQAEGGAYWFPGDVAGDLDAYWYLAKPTGASVPDALEHGILIEGTWDRDIQRNHPGWPYVDLSQPDLGPYVRAGGGYAAAIRLDTQDAIAVLRAELLRGQR